MRSLLLILLMALTNSCAIAAKSEAPWDSFRVDNAHSIFADKRTAELAIAAAKGDTKAIDRMLAQGANVNAVGEYGQTLEKCDTRQCPNRIPHPPQPDPDAGSPRFREPSSAKRRRKEDR